MRKVLTYSLIGTFILLNLADLVTTLICYYIKPNFNELNPLYLLIGNIWVSLLISKGIVIFIIIIAYFWVLKHKGEIARYVIVLALILGCLMLFVAVYNNIKLIKNPSLSVDATEYITYEAKKLNITQNEFKAEIYRNEYVTPYFKSLGLILLIFVVFKRIRDEND